jgi:cell division septation protein DedD
MKPLQPDAANAPSAAPAETGNTPMQADATTPEVDSSKPKDADPMPMAANDDHEPATTPQMPAPPPGGPIVKAAAVVSPLPPGKHAWIQIASFRSEQNAQSAWNSMTNGNQDLLRYVPLSVRRVDLGAEKGVYYVLRIGPLADMSQARDLCTALKDRQITCVVAK